MHLFDLPYVLALLDKIIIDLIEVCNCSKPRSRELCKRVKVESVDHEEDSVKERTKNSNHRNVRHSQ
jgi:hypothetical protein